jgi:hypothetical protein
MTAVIPAKPGRHVMQVAFVVEDIERAVAEWVRTTGIGPFFLVPHIELADFEYRGKKGAGLDFSVALAQSGGVQIELIEQHCDSPSAYRDTVAKGSEGFHHLCIYTADYDRTRQHYVDEGFAVAVDGLFGDMRFCYVDTSPSIGCMMEIVEEHPLETDFFTRIAEAAGSWDRETDPLRPGFPS